MTVKDKIVHNKKTFLEHLDANAGNVSAACKLTGIGRQTYYNWIKDDEEFKSEVNDLYESLDDVVESQLRKNINEGKETSIIFYAKTKMKHRGYQEKTEIEGNLTIKDELSPEQRKIMYRTLKSEFEGE